MCSTGEDCQNVVRAIARSGMTLDLVVLVGKRRTTSQYDMCLERKKKNAPLREKTAFDAAQVAALAELARGAYCEKEKAAPTHNKTFTQSRPPPPR